MRRLRAIAQKPSEPVPPGDVFAILYSQSYALGSELPKLFCQQKLHRAEKSRGLERVVGGGAGMPSTPVGSVFVCRIFAGMPPIMERRARDALFRLQETIADKTVVPVVRIAYLNFVLAFAHGGGNVNLPRSAPHDAAVNTIDKDVCKTTWKRAKRECDCGIMKLWKYGIV